jgi:hypothetical protein
MFSLVHFSRVFPYIHPYLFPVETPQPADSAPARNRSVSCSESAGAGNSANLEDAAASCRAGHGKRRRTLYRRHLLNLRNDALTYSAGVRHPA